MRRAGEEQGLCGLVAAERWSRALGTAGKVTEGAECHSVVPLSGGTLLPGTLRCSQRESRLLPFGASSAPLTPSGTLCSFPTGLCLSSARPRTSRDGPVAQGLHPENGQCPPPALSMGKGKRIGERVTLASTCPTLALTVFITHYR